MNRWISLLVSLISLAVAASVQAAEVSGKIGYMSGALIAQRLDGTIKVMAPKAEVFEGDVLVTAKDSYAQVVMNDGTKMTLRPNSNLKIESYQFKKESPQADNAVFRLIKGGFRTVTGFIGKRGNPDAYKLRVATATLGIRGTDFTSRLCATQNCQDDGEVAKPAKPTVEQPKAVGRVMLIQGQLAAEEANGRVRKLGLGSPVYEGDTLKSSAKSHGVMAFRDGGRITLQENSVFQVEQYKYDKTTSQENVALRLIKGGVRVVTGLIGRVNHDNYKFAVAGATIGIRGTGFDAWCNGPCAEGVADFGATPGKPLDGAGVFVWQGEVLLVAPGGSFTVALNQAAIIARLTGKPVQILAIPPGILDNSAPRPDSIPVDIDKLFEESTSSGEPGFYVTVHDGQVVLSKDDISVDLGKGETGFTDGEIVTRLSKIPGFMGGDSKLDNIEDNKFEQDKGCMVGS
ncbi:MAG: FecR domain-containing protein [Sideroxyarcus sp.]|nr:FecR domain-containing protein [Sideroxyarcus sp.]